MKLNQALFRLSINKQRGKAMKVRHLSLILVALCGVAFAEITAPTGNVATETAARIAADALKLNVTGGTATNLTLIGLNHIILPAASDTAANGNLLLSTYAPLSGRTTDYTIFLSPGVYDLGAQTLNMTNEYVNIVGTVPVTITTIGKVVVDGLTNHSAVITGDRPASKITGSGLTISNEVNNSIVKYIETTGHVITGADKSATWEDVWFAGPVDDAGSEPSGQQDTSNTFIRVYAAQGIASGSGAGSPAFSGLAEACVILSTGGVTGIMGGGGVVSGTINNSTVTGDNCVAGGAGTMSGTINNSTISGEYCVGGDGGTMSGTINNSLISGYYALTGNNGELSGTINNSVVIGNTSCGFSTISGEINKCVFYGPNALGDFCTFSGTLFRSDLHGSGVLENVTISSNAVFSFSTGIPLSATNSTAKIFNCADDSYNAIPNQ